MPRIVRDLPTVTFSSGATNSPSWKNVDDADVLVMYCLASTSALTVNVEQSDTGTNFLPLLQDGSTGGTPVTVSSSGAVTLTAIAFRQLRFSSTGAVNSGTSVNGSRQIFV